MKNLTTASEITDKSQETTENQSVQSHLSNVSSTIQLTAKPSAQTESFVSSPSLARSLENSIPLPMTGSPKTVIGTKSNTLIASSSPMTLPSSPLAVARKSAPTTMNARTPSQSLSVATLSQRPSVSQTQTSETPKISTLPAPNENLSDKNKETTQFQDILAIAAQSADIYETISSAPTAADEVAKQTSTANFLDKGVLSNGLPINPTNTFSLMPSSVNLSTLNSNHHISTTGQLEGNQAQSNFIDGVVSYETRNASQIGTQIPFCPSSQLAAPTLQFNPSALGNAQQCSLSSNLNLVQPFNYLTPANNNSNNSNSIQHSFGSTLNSHSLGHFSAAAAAAPVNTSGPLPPIAQIFAHTKSRSTAPLGNFYTSSLQLNSVSNISNIINNNIINNSNNNSSTTTNSYALGPTYSLSLASAATQAPPQPVSISQLANIAPSQLTVSPNSVATSQPATAAALSIASPPQQGLPSLNLAPNQVSPVLQGISVPLVNQGTQQQAQKINFLYQMNNSSGSFVLLSPPPSASGAPQSNRVILVQVKNTLNKMTPPIGDQPQSSNLQTAYPLQQQPSTTLTNQLSSLAGLPFQPTSEQKQASVQNSESLLSVIKQSTVGTEEIKTSLEETIATKTPSSKANEPKAFCTNAAENVREPESLQKSKTFSFSNTDFLNNGSVESTSKIELNCAKICLQTDNSELGKSTFQTQEKISEIDKQSNLFSTHQLNTSVSLLSAQNNNSQKSSVFSDLQINSLKEDKLSSSVSLIEKSTAEHHLALSSSLLTPKFTDQYLNNFQNETSSNCNNFEKTFASNDFSQKEKNLENYTLTDSTMVFSNLNQVSNIMQHNNAGNSTLSSTPYSITEETKTKNAQNEVANYLNVKNSNLSENIFETKTSTVTTYKPEKMFFENNVELQLNNLNEKHLFEKNNAKIENNENEKIMFNHQTNFISSTNDNTELQIVENAQIEKKLDCLTNTDQVCTNLNNQEFLKIKQEQHLITQTTTVSSTKNNIFKTKKDVSIYVCFCYIYLIF